MKRIGKISALLICFSFAIHSEAKVYIVPVPVRIPIANSDHFVRVDFDTMWIDYDIFQSDIRGMLIHLKFTVFDMKDVDADVAIYFEYDDDRGGRLRDKNSKFNSSGGDVAVYKAIKPSYSEAVFKDLQVFMPYDELDLKSGKYDLKMIINMIYPNGDLVQHLDEHKFTFTKP